MKKLKLFLCLLCCGRIELLKETLQSFIKNCSDLQDYDLHVVVSDDSGDEELNAMIVNIVDNQFPQSKKYFRFGENVGQAASYWHISNLIKNLDFDENDLTFMLEEDWKFTDNFSIKTLKENLNSTFKFQNSLINFCAVILKTDVDDFEKYPSYGYNIAEFNKNVIIIAPPDLQFVSKTKGNCVHNDIISFHPHLMKAKDVTRYCQKYELKDLIRMKESAEKLLGKITEGLRVFVIDKVYAMHTGIYRIHSVFPGAKIRAGISIIDIDDYKRGIL